MDQDKTNDNKGARVIPLNRELKITLLRWLKNGGINILELHAIREENEMTLDEINAEIARLSKLDNCVI